MRMSNFNWGPGLFILAYHAGLLIGLPIYLFYHPVSWGLFGLSVALVFITGISVTAGYHRLYSHTTYKIHPAVEAVLLFFATMATQGSALRWSFDHRHHHAFVDTDRDPYSIKKGFWYAHFLWLFEKPKPIDEKVVADLVKNRLIRFQHRYYPILMFMTNALIVGFVGWACGSLLESFLYIWLLRVFLLHHLTWFINSLAHTWGDRPFCQELSAVDNYLISLLTFGEGYHNYHHTYAYDYRNGIRWYHFDPTKWLIWLLSKLGLASRLRRVERSRIEEKLVIDRAQQLLTQLRTSLLTQKEEWESKVIDMREKVLVQLRQMQELRAHYQSLKKRGEATRDYLQELSRQVKEKKRGFREEYRKWKALYRDLQQRALN